MRDGFVVRNVVEVCRLALAGEIDVVVPKHDPAGSVDAGSDFHDRGRAEGVVKELFGTGPGNLDRPAHRFGEHRGLVGLLVERFAAKTAAEKRSDDANILRRENRSPGQSRLGR